MYHVNCGNSFLFALSLFDMFRAGDFSCAINPVYPPEFADAIISWHRKLCIAQKNLFCKELFAQVKVLAVL